MTNEEALKRILWFRDDSGVLNIKDLAALDMAIEALQNSLPAPTQDGTAEEVIQELLDIEYPDDPQYANLESALISRKYCIQAMYNYAAPLRAEIERLKSELAASVNPKLVMPSEQTSKLIQIAASLLTDRLSEDPQEWHNDRKAPKWLIKRIVRFATLYNDKNRDRSRIIKEVVDELRRPNPSILK